MSELALELEATVSGRFRYTEDGGWAAEERLAFEVVALERQVVGNNIPLPAAVLRCVRARAPPVAPPPTHTFTRDVLASTARLPPSPLPPPAARCSPPNVLLLPLTPHLSLNSTHPPQTPPLPLFEIRKSKQATGPS